MMHQPKKHAILTCYDERLDPVISQYEEDAAKAGDIFVRPVRPIGGIHFMTRGKCSNFLCGQIQGFVEIIGVDVIDLFMHTDCQFNRRAHRSRLERVESDMAFQIATLEKVHQGTLSHLAANFPGKEIQLNTRIIHTEEKRILTLDEAKKLLPDHHHHHHRNKGLGHCDHHRYCTNQGISTSPA